jgi:putative hydrolase of the HAD superfamily
LGEITVVTFDLWQTLILDRRDLSLARAQIRLESTRDALAHFCEDYGLEHIREAYRSCYRQCQQIRNEHLAVTFREQVGMFINNISVDLVDHLDRDTVAEIVRVYADSFLVHPPTVSVDALTVLRDLKGMGLRLDLISNTGMTPGVTFRTFLEAERMLGYFDALTFSDEVKLAKPSKEIFLMTLRSMGATPD